MNFIKFVIWTDRFLSGTIQRVIQTLKSMELVFNQAKEIFKDDNIIESPDKRKDYGEERFKVIGRALDLILSVIYTKRGNVIRIISARFASKKEREDYKSNI